MPDRPPPLEDLNELLFRQVHPSFIRDGRPSSQAFRPTAKDDGELSVSRETLTTPERAFRHHTEQLELGSAGTWAVTVGEAREQSLLSYPDPIEKSEEAVADPAHAIIDFVPIAAKNQREAKAVRLQRKATARGRLYPSTEIPPGS
jgi:hypothetical protein